MAAKTDKLGSELNRVKPKSIGIFLEKNKELMLDGKREFTLFMRETVKNKNIKWKNIYMAAGISDEYGQELIGLRKHTMSRDLIIRICIAGKFNLEETQHALTLYGMQPLYPRKSRDAVLIVAINSRVYELSDVDDLLEKQGMEIISKNLE